MGYMQDRVGRTFGMQLDGSHVGFQVYLPFPEITARGRYLLGTTLTRIKHKAA
jgi:hypothetical protein